MAEREKQIVQIALKNQSPSIQESLQSLRTNLQYIQDLQVITITSTLPGEGKSSLSLNLAASFASAGYNTLLIDADLRKSRLKQYTQARSSKPLTGLSDFLSGMSSDLIYETNYDHLDIIFSGKTPPDPASSLSSDLFGKMLSILRKNYDYILIDTSPVMAAVDSMIVGRQSDGVLYGVYVGKTKRAMARKCVERLRRGGCKLIGVYMNGIEKADYQYEKYDEYYR